jgi:hypothetical protein
MVSHSPISVECLFLMTLLPGGNNEVLKYLRQVSQNIKDQAEAGAASTRPLLGSA